MNSRCAALEQWRTEFSPSSAFSYRKDAIAVEGCLNVDTLLVKRKPVLMAFLRSLIQNHPQSTDNITCCTGETCFSCTGFLGLEKVDLAKLKFFFLAAATL